MGWAMLKSATPSLKTTDTWEEVSNINRGKGLGLISLVELYFLLDDDSYLLVIIL